MGTLHRPQHLQRELLKYEAKQRAEWTDAYGNIDKEPGVSLRASSAIRSAT